MVCMRDERLARCSCRHPVIINLNLLSLFSWHHPFSSICHHDVTLYQFLKVLNLKTLFVLLSMSNCNRLQAIQPFIREPVQKFQAEKKVHKHQNLFFNIQRVPSNTFLQQVAFKSHSYTFFCLATPSFLRPSHNWPASSHLPKLFFPRSAQQQQQQGKHQTICKGYLPTNDFQQLFVKGIY